MKKWIFLCFFFSLFNVFNIQAQDDDPDSIGSKRMVEITLTDGSVIVGELISSQDDVWVLEANSLGRLEININQIKESQFLTNEEQVKDVNGIPFDFHNSTHYIVGPSGYGLKKGQSYYENIYIFWNSYTTGITDNFSISMGGEILSLLFTSSFPVIFVSPKFSFPFKDNSGAAAIGGTFFTSPEADFTTFGFVTGTVTLGHRNNNFSLSTGIGWSSEDGFEDSIVPLGFSTMQRLGSKVSLVSENWLLFNNNFDDAFGVLSAGLRIHFKKPGSAFNVGLFRPTEEVGNLIAIPYVSTTIALN